MKPRLAFALLLAASTAAFSAEAADWPQFRYNAGRTAASPDGLPADLELSWRRALPSPCPAFPGELRLAYDVSYEPVVADGTMFVPSMVNDSVTAFDTDTGDELWRFFAEGPVRFAPVAHHGSVYFVSDDGYLYCLRAHDGSLRWKFRGVPDKHCDRKVLGHGRLISMFPARGGPVLADGVVYFAAGLWPTEGVFVHAIDAESGEAVWSNTEGSLIPQSNWDHGIGGTSGLTPQGYLAIVDGKLVVPCGAQLPAFLDLKTGKLEDYTMGWGGRNGLPKGCWFVAGAGRYLSHGGDLYDISRPSSERFPDTKQGKDDWKSWLYPGGWTRLEIEPATRRELDEFTQPVMTQDVIYTGGQNVVARDLSEVTLREIAADEVPPHRAQDQHPDTLGGNFRKLWELPSKLRLHIKAGNRLYLAGPLSPPDGSAVQGRLAEQTTARTGNAAPGRGVVEAVDTTGNKPKIVWRAEIDGTPHRMLAADDKLFLVTVEGSILAFAEPQPGEPKTHRLPIDEPPPADSWTDMADAILDATSVADGYALVLGIEEGRLVEELLRQSELHVIAVDDNPAEVAALRRRLHRAGWYGTRASALVADPMTCRLPPYMANLVTTETPQRFEEADERALAAAVFHVLRPYGGVACAWGSLADRARIEAIATAESFPGAQTRQVGRFVLLGRSGALPGAAAWSHAQANAACTGASEEEFARPPLSILWFDAARRWHKYPGQNQVRVAGGRLILLEEGVLAATDVYTGRRLWEIEVPIGAKPLADRVAREAVRYRKHRQWGPKPSLASSTELVAVDDAIYLTQGTSCLVFDPGTGTPAGKIELPEGLSEPWSNVRIEGNQLLGSSGPHILCMDRRSGELLWRAEASRSTLSIAVGNDKVFCAELPNPRHGDDATADGNLFALCRATGKRLWQRPGGARLRYSPKLDIVVTPAALFRGADGEPISQPSDSPEARFAVEGHGLPKMGIPAFIAGKRLLAGSQQALLVFDLPSGQPAGDVLRWVCRGCTGTRASMHLLTTRYRGNSAWIDLETRAITPLLGVRPGCSTNNNLYPANGVLNVPNVTAGCTCNYMPASVACVPTRVVCPEAEK